MVATAWKPIGTVAHDLSSFSASPLSAVTVIVIVVALIASAWQNARTVTLRRARGSTMAGMLNDGGGASWPGSRLRGKCDLAWPDEASWPSMIASRPRDR